MRGVAVALLILTASAVQAEVKLSGSSRAGLEYGSCSPATDSGCKVIRFDDSDNFDRSFVRLVGFGPEVRFVMDGHGSIDAVRAITLPYPLGRAPDEAALVSEE